MKQEYNSPDYCISCIYFKKDEGNFGHCSSIPEKTYDGTKKGTGCINWRINQTLIQIQKPIETNKSLRYTYNKIQREKKPVVRFQKIRKYVKEDRVYTSNTQSKNGYYKHRYNFTIIDRALTLHLNGKNYHEISADFNKHNYRIPDRRTLREWVIKFLGKNAWYSISYASPTIKCDCGGFCVKNGFDHGKQRWKCSVCKHNIQ